MLETFEKISDGILDFSASLMEDLGKSSLGISYVNFEEALPNKEDVFMFLLVCLIVFAVKNVFRISKVAPKRQSNHWRRMANADIGKNLG